MKVANEIFLKKAPETTKEWLIHGHLARYTPSCLCSWSTGYSVYFKLSFSPYRGM